MVNSILNDIQFVIVLYNETLENSVSFKDISKSVNMMDLESKVSIFIYDNSKEPQKININNIWEYEYFHDSNNSGLSIAYNTAAEFAKKKEKKWLFLLDQDTEFPNTTIQIYLKAIAENTNIFLFAPILKVKTGEIISPYKYSLKRRKRTQSIQSGLQKLSKTGPVNSGLCIGLNSFLAVDGYNDKVKVDGADFQFIERYKRKYSEYYVLDLIAYQDLSLFEKDFQKLIFRYKIFLNDLSGFEKFQKIDCLLFFLYAINRTVKLTLQTKKSDFLKLFFAKFILRKKI
ncbi:glycosyltransferase [Chryseobacterium sp. YIM B08800]|uniref:glycosyltransferase n=1 Tax=Chryseobacterium sp. YIM B08800 TaxID=2984136 RepID=UPI002240604B|nr:glycosyltransferase [Chryseobacterium sp. YIM B08800]